MAPAENEMDALYARLEDRGVDNAEFQSRRADFVKRGGVAEDYLLDRLARETNPALQGDVLQMLGKLRYHGGRRSAETATWARRLLGSEVAQVRCRALWVLGWVGGPDDLERLSEALHSDADADNRGWAATAMMQLHLADPTDAARWLGPLKLALRQESEETALERILISVQEISGRRLGLKSSSHERASKEKLDAALRRALLL